MSRIRKSKHLIGIVTKIWEVDGLETELAKKQDKILDTGWVKLEFTGGISDSDVYIRREGSDVTVRGWMLSPAESYDIGNLAEMFRPISNERPVVWKDDAGGGRANLHFNTDGKIRINLNVSPGVRINLYNIRWKI
ncbi:hypothetical protein [Carnobacterium maltaromaticum]|uniref:hypothetical protein n=1 Tax=Carnobacterium maltaromaticum TaxID=2751 RepID=UPI00107196EA|nr:hypothetical protein [Carnobacterium maltaromaticum]TFJ71875.1 hypothetical protein CKN94_11795 [Carnobacterium maltaromaticum]TFJ76788.1 hypothetical protein CKN97_11785 [Carnobacterium maltaromaticum]